MKHENSWTLKRTFLQLNGTPYHHYFLLPFTLFSEIWEMKRRLTNLITTNRISEFQEMSTEQRQTLRNLATNVTRKFKNIRHPIDCFERFLNLVEGLYSAVNVSAIQNPSEFADLFGSDIMETVIGCAYQQSVHSRFILLRDFIFVLLFLRHIDLRVCYSQKIMTRIILYTFESFHFLIIYFSCFLLLFD
jgi:hypothetical protein